MVDDYEFDIPPDDKIIEINGRFLRSLNEQEFRIKNVKWKIHQSDPDPFPSRLHAHDYENNRVLDIYSGNLYNNTRQEIGRLSRKQLALIHQDIQKSNNGIIKNLLNNQ